MSKAQDIVDQMLESDYDEHVKAHKLVQTWDNAHASAKQLLGLKRQALDKFKEMGRAIGYERALAHVGLKRADVESYIYGAQIGSTDNYKRTRPAKICVNRHCGLKKPQPVGAQECWDCREPLELTEVPLSHSDIHKKFANHILGVRTNDGRSVWFDEPVPPTFDVEADDPESVAPKAKPNRPYAKNFDIRRD